MRKALLFLLGGILGALALAGGEHAATDPYWADHGIQNLGNLPAPPEKTAAVPDIQRAVREIKTQASLVDPDRIGAPTVVGFSRFLDEKVAAIRTACERATDAEGQPLGGRMANDGLARLAARVHQIQDFYSQRAAFDLPADGDSPDFDRAHTLLLRSAARMMSSPERLESGETVEDLWKRERLAPHDPAFFLHGPIPAGDGGTGYPPAAPPFYLQAVEKSFQKILSDLPDQIGAAAQCAVPDGGDPRAPRPCHCDLDHFPSSTTDLGYRLQKKNAFARVEFIADGVLPPSACRFDSHATDASGDALWYPNFNYLVEQLLRACEKAEKGGTGKEQKLVIGNVDDHPRHLTLSSAQAECLLANTTFTCTPSPLGTLPPPAPLQVDAIGDQRPPNGAGFPSGGDTPLWASLPVKKCDWSVDALPAKNPDHGTIQELARGDSSADKSDPKEIAAEKAQMPPPFLPAGFDALDHFVCLYQQLYQATRSSSATIGQVGLIYQLFDKLADPQSPRGFARMPEFELYRFLPGRTTLFSSPEEVARARAWLQKQAAGECEALRRRIDGHNDQVIAAAGGARLGTLGELEPSIHGWDNLPIGDAGGLAIYHYEEEREDPDRDYPGLGKAFARQGQDGHDAQVSLWDQVLHVAPPYSGNPNGGFHAKVNGGIVQAEDLGADLVTGGFELKSFNPYAALADSAVNAVNAISSAKNLERAARYWGQATDMCVSLSSQSTVYEKQGDPRAAEYADLAACCFRNEDCYKACLPPSVNVATVTVSVLPWGDALLSLPGINQMTGGPVQIQANGVAASCASCVDDGLAILKNATIDRKTLRVQQCGGWKP
jgi:hypothetical protein